MTVAVSFYHLMLTPPDKVVPRLVEKIYKSGLRVVIVTEDESQLKAINTVLWTYTTLGFLPHGSVLDGEFNNPDYPNWAMEQPIWVTTTLENPNNATVCVVCSEQIIEPSTLGFDRLLYIADATSEEACQAIAQKQSHYESKGCNVAAWVQTKEGWKKKDQ